MERIEYNLIAYLDALLSEGSVTAAAARMHVSPSAMSRMLGRLREVTGDPILVRAGAELVPTPHAECLREPVRAAVQEVRRLLQPGEAFTPRNLRRNFILRANDAFAGQFAATLLHRVAHEAPAASVVLLPEGEEDVSDMREGKVDVDIGEVTEDAPELIRMALFRDHFLGAVRVNHPLANGEIDVARLADHPHVGVSRRGKKTGPIDVALAERGLERHMALVVPSYHGAITAALHSDLVVAAPGRILRHKAFREELHVFDFPFPLPELNIAMTWHPRFGADPAHKWFRGIIRQVASGF